MQTLPETKCGVHTHALIASRQRHQLEGCPILEYEPNPIRDAIWASTDRRETQSACPRCGKCGLWLEIPVRSSISAAEAETPAAVLWKKIPLRDFLFLFPEHFQGIPFFDGLQARLRCPFLTLEIIVWSTTGSISFYLFPAKTVSKRCLWTFI